MLGASIQGREDHHEAWRQERSWRVKPSSITGCQDKRCWEQNGEDTRIGILKTDQSQETSEANEGAEEGELKRKLIPGVSIFWNQDCFKMVEHGSLRSLRQEVLKEQLIVECCFLQSFRI